MASEAGIEYEVFTPVKTFTGETAKFEFYRGRAKINDAYAREMGYKDAVEAVTILVSDFGYSSSPVLPVVPARDPRLSLRERAERAEPANTPPARDGNIAPFFPPEAPIGATSESTVEPGHSRFDAPAPDPTPDPAAQ